ncbi:MAG: Maf family nucleotide pyrophosphatase [Dokdonella sp.]
MTDRPGVELVLASTSRYRRELLARLALAFRSVAPEVDESRRSGEPAAVLAERLAQAKAHAVAASCPHALVIGSDQVAELDGCVLGKPGTADAARAQLAASSGQRVTFHTALCLLDTRNGRSDRIVDATHVVFRSLQGDEIARYVDAEQPLDCAGSFKAEGLGISLFERIESDDPTALIGLPLIALSRLLRKAGVRLP